MGEHIQQNQRDWSSGLFSCMDDVKSCLCGLFCWPCLFCNIGNRTGESGLAVCCCVPGGIIALRTKIRTMYGITGTICGDCLCSYFCGQCVLCQMDRELKQLGL